MDMFVRFLKPCGQYVAGQTVELPEPIARAWLALPDTAVEVSSDPQARAIQEALSHITPLLQEQGKAIAAELRRSNGRATRPDLHAGQDVEFSSIEGTESEVDKRRGPGGWLRNIVRTEIGTPEERTLAHQELTRPWGEGGYGCARAMLEGAGSTGGYTTPTTYESQMFEVAAEQEIIIPACEHKPLGSRTTFWPALDQYQAPGTGQSAFYGGMQVFRRGESIQRTEKDLKFKRIELTAQDLTAYTEISRDLVMDSSVSIDSTVIRMMGAAIGWRCDWESINGTGVGQLLGYLNSPALLSVFRNTSSHLKYQDFFRMKTRLLSNIQSPCWIVHPYTLEEIYGLVDGSNRLIFVPNAFTNVGAGGDAGGSMTFKLAGSILGYPVYSSEKVPVLAAANDVTLIDRKYYWYGQRSGLEVGLSEHFKFDTDELSIRAKIRNDGKPGLLAPITLADGTAKVSAFVGLAATTS